jgi:transcription-repair coupling factor (superfamily II helicase)
VSSFKIIENNNYDIILVEEFPCQNKDQLHARERFFIENTECVNKYIPTRTPKEYYEDHKEKISERWKQYYETNKEKLNEKKKEYLLKNKEKLNENKGKIKEYNKQYRLKNKEKLKILDKEKYLKNKEKISEYNKQKYLKNKEKTKLLQNVISPDNRVVEQEDCLYSI